MPKSVLFFGGPLDGHRQDLLERKTPIPKVLQIEVSTNTVRLLTKQPFTPGAATTSVATYELRGDRYCFVAAKKPAEKCR